MFWVELQKKEERGKPQCGLKKEKKKEMNNVMTSMVAAHQLEESLAHSWRWLEVGAAKTPRLGRDEQGMRIIDITVFLEVVLA